MNRHLYIRYNTSYKINNTEKVKDNNLNQENIGYFETFDASKNIKASYTGGREKASEPSTPHFRAVLTILNLFYSLVATRNSKRVILFF